MIFSPQFVRGVVSHIFPNLRKTQRVNLGLAVYGQVISQSTILSQIVRDVPGAVKHRHRLKRLWRFVSNGRVKPERLFDFWVPWVVNQFVPGKYVTVALDWTGLPGNHVCLVASLVLLGRAVPLLWQVTQYSNLKDSTNRIEQRLISRLVNLTPQGKRLVILADRGFGRAGFFRFLLAKRLLFAVRVEKHVRVTPKVGRAFLLSTLASKLESDFPRWYEDVAYRDDQAVAGVNLAATVAPGSNDPWFLVTNLASPVSAVGYYSLRFQIEEGFKDVKHALGLDKVQTRNLTRLRRLLLVTAVSQALLMLVGKLAWRLTRLRQTVVTGGKQACSRIQLAIHFIRHRLLGQSFWSRVRAAALGP